MNDEQLNLSLSEAIQELLSLPVLTLRAMHKTDKGIKSS